MEKLVQHSESYLRLKINKPGQGSGRLLCGISGSEKEIFLWREFPEMSPGAAAFKAERHSRDSGGMINIFTALSNSLHLANCRCSSTDSSGACSEISCLRDFSLRLKSMNGD